jgi:hypothetical protein
VIAGDFRRGCSTEPHIYEAGACVIAGTGARAAARCFTAAEIASGAAVAVAAPGLAYGIVPDGFDSVNVSWDGGGAAATVHDNVYELRLDGAGAGDRVRVELSGASAGCAPSAAAYEAVPALEVRPTRTPPRALADAMDRLGARGDWLAYARLVTTRDGVDIWVVPDMPCDRPGSREERVCLLPVRGGHRGDFFCDTLAEAHGERDAWTRSGELVAGFAPAGARWVEARTGRSGDGVLMRVQDGVFGGLIKGPPDAAVALRFR